MNKINFTYYHNIVLFLSILLFLVSYLFQNIFYILSGISILIFLIFSKFNFIERIGIIEIKREILEKQIFVNHPINVKISVKNQGKRINIRLIETLQENTHLLNGNNKLSKKINPGEEIFMNYSIKFMQRGKKIFPKLQLTLRDQFNLYEVNVSKTIETVIWVHSDPSEIKKAKRISQREHIEITTSSLVGLETTDELEGVRIYRPGDRLKDIEWKATSRLQRLMTKFFEKKDVLDTVFLLDCSYSMRISSGKKSKIGHASNLLIHLTKILQSIRHPVGLIAYDEIKIIKSLNPTNNYSQIFKSLTDLPEQIQTDEYQIKDTYETPKQIIDNYERRNSFLSNIFPFLVQGKRNVNNPLQATGIYEGLRHLMIENKLKHIIIITDMENNTLSLYRTIYLAHSKGYNIWLLSFFSPYYNITKKDISSEQLENIYTLHSDYEKILHRLRKMNIDIVELNPTMESANVVEILRGKNK